MANFSLSKAKVEAEADMTAQKKALTPASNQSIFDKQSDFTLEEAIKKDLGENNLTLDDCATLDERFSLLAGDTGNNDGWVIRKVSCAVYGSHQDGKHYNWCQNDTDPAKAITIYAEILKNHKWSVKNIQRNTTPHIQSHTPDLRKYVGRYCKSELGYLPGLEVFDEWCHQFDGYDKTKVEGFYSKLKPGYSHKDLSNAFAVSRRSFQLISSKTLLSNAKPIPWLVKGLIPSNSTGMLFGAPASAKSLMAMLLASCVASGDDFSGQPIRQKGGAVYLAGEGNHGIGQRLKAIHIEHGINTDGIHFSNIPLMLDEKECIHVTDAIDVLDLDKISLVIVDTLARHMSGDESASTDASRLIKNLDGIRKKYSCTVLLIHHAGHSDKGRARGSSAIKGALDFEYRLEKSEDIVSMGCTKAKDFKEPEPINFMLVSVDIGLKDEDGLPVESATLVPTNDKPVSTKKLTLPENKILGQLSAGKPTTKDYLKHSIVTDGGLTASGAKDAERKALNRGLKSLTERNLIAIQNENITLLDNGQT